MYFKHKFYLLNIKKSKQFKDLTTNEKNQALLKLYDDYIKRHLKPARVRNDNNELKISFRFLQKFQWYLLVIQELEIKNISVNEYFKIKRKYCRAEFFKLKNLFIKLINKYHFNWKEYIGKLPIKKFITYKYNDEARKILCDYYIEYCKENIGFEITNFWCTVHINNELSDKYDFSKISLNTLKNILKMELGICFKKHQKKYKHHPKRSRIIEPGHIQLDLKVLGKKETGINQTIHIFDMIDTHSRFAYFKVLDTADTQSVLDALKAGHRYFSKNGIKIKSVQTDNAMMFKGTNFIHANEFVKYLKDKKIIKRLIPLGEPQCNGCIERLHKTIDSICSPSLMNAKTMDEVKQILFMFMYQYNFKRYHYYSELEFLPYEKRFLIPKNVIKSTIMNVRSGPV